MKSSIWARENSLMIQHQPKQVIEKLWQQLHPGRTWLIPTQAVWHLGGDAAAHGHPVDDLEDRKDDFWEKSQHSRIRCRMLHDDRNERESSRKEGVEGLARTFEEVCQVYSLFKQRWQRDLYSWPTGMNKALTVWTSSYKQRTKPQRTFRTSSFSTKSHSDI